MYNRFKYLDSKYLAGDALKDTIMFRAYVPIGPKPDITVTPYQNMYVAALYRNGDTVTPIRAEKGQSVTLKNTVEESATETDQETIIYSASQLMDIGDISVFRPGYADFSHATKLQRLQIGSNKQSYENANLKMLNVGANHLLTYLDARNCTNLGTDAAPGEQATPSIDLSQCYSIEEVYFDNTQIKGVSFPVGGNLKKIHLPGTLVALAIRNHPNLEEFVIEGTQKLTSLWLENIPSDVINAYDYIMGMPESSRVRLIGFYDSYMGSDSTNKIRMLYDKLDLLKGLDGNGDVVDKAQVTGTIKVDAIAYADYVEFTSRQPEITIEANVITCLVIFNNYDGTMFNSQGVIQGRLANNPGIPEKPSTQAHYYEFVRWEYKDGGETKVWNPGVVIEKDLVMEPVFEELTQRYTVVFDTKSDIITVTPPQVTAYYGDKISAPTIDWIPPAVTHVGWFRPNGQRWNFDSDQVLDNITLGARWQDLNTPQFTEFGKIRLNAFRYAATDNLGIVAYAFMTGEGEPTDWTAITSTTDFSGEYTIEDAAEEYHFWIKDANDNTASEKLIGRLISRNIAVGVTKLRLFETVGDETYEAENFALDGTLLGIEAELDTHYKELALHYELTDGETETSGDISGSEISEYTIKMTGNLALTATCSPKSYIVHFDNNGYGVKPDDASVVYLTRIPKPLDQYDKTSGQVIVGWTTDPEGEHAWDFDSDILTAECIDNPTESLTLYAQWREYSSPTHIIINIPQSEDPDYEGNEVSINFSQHVKDAVYIVYDGDLSNPERSGSNIISVITMCHTFATPGEHTIDIYGPANGDYHLGGGYNSPLVMPTKYVTAVDFSWNVSELGQYVLRSTRITVAPLTNYMTKISIGAFQGCDRLTSVTFTPSIKEIEDNAFMDCRALTGTITLPDNITRMGQMAFYQCTGLTGLVIGKGLNELPLLSFGNCTSLANVSIGQNVKVIGESAFKNCTSLEYLYVPETVNELHTSAFESCRNLSKVILANKRLNLDLSSQQHSMFRWCDLLNSAGPIGSGADIEFSWETEIPNWFFYEAYALETVQLPLTLARIGESAFG